MNDTLLGILLGAIGAVFTALVRLRRGRPPGAATGASWLRRAFATGVVDLLLLIPTGAGFALTIALQVTDGFNTINIAVLVGLLAVPVLWLVNEELLRPLRSLGFPVRGAVAFIVVVIAAVGAIGVLTTERGQTAPKPSLHVGAQYPVVGTAIDGHPGLNQRLGPGREYTAVKKRLPDGAWVTPVCVAFGSPPLGHHSRRWLRLDTGLFVSALFVDLPAGPQRLPTCRPDQLPDHVI